MSGPWSPIHENHAIDNMAIVVAFSQPIPDLAFKKALRQAEEVAFANGLRSRHSIHQMQVVIGQDSSAASQQTKAGQLFNSATSDESDGAATTRVSEQLKIEQASFTYRTWDYVSWQYQWERISTLLGSPLNVLEGIVGWATIRMEYLDRFRLDADAVESNLQSLLREDSRWLAPHIFDKKGLWHNHTGCYLPPEEMKNKLLQVFVDMQDQPYSASKSEMVRWVNIIAARQNIFNTDDEDSFDLTMLREQLDTMHIELKTLLNEIITDAYAKRIYLFKDHEK